MSIITKHPGVNWSIRNKSLSFGLKAAIHLQGEFPDTYTALTRLKTALERIWWRTGRCRKLQKMARILILSLILEGLWVIEARLQRYHRSTMLQDDDQWTTMQHDRNHKWTFNLQTRTCSRHSVFVAIFIRIFPNSRPFGFKLSYSDVLHWAFHSFSGMLCTYWLNVDNCLLVCLDSIDLFDSTWNGFQFNDSFILKAPIGAAQ